MSQEQTRNSVLGNLSAFAAVLAAIAVVGLISFRLFFVDFVDNYQVAYKYDKRNGEMTILKEKGYIVTPPVVVQVHTIDMRPQAVCLSANTRVLNCKLVQFDLKGLSLFLSWHGRADYEGGNQTDANGHRTGAGCNTPFCNLLAGYAYDDKQQYSFLHVLKDGEGEAVAPAKVAQ